MRQTTFFLQILAVFLLLAAPSGAAELRPAAELAAELRAKIGRTFDIPAPTKNVIAAEQRDAKIVVFKSGADWNSPDAVVWEWSAADSPEIAPENRGWFSNLSECKTVRGETCVLVVASGGGVALIRIADKKLLFYGFAGGNTHSAAILPDGNIVAASSTGAYLSLFVAPELAEDESVAGPTPVAAKVEFFDAHGLVWDSKRETLWAFGGKDLAGYKYVGTKNAPALEEIFRVQPTGAAFGGHDLAPVPGFDALTATGRGVAVFDPAERKIYDVSQMGRVKSLSVDPQGTPLMQRAVEEWWSETIFYADEANSPVGTFDGAKFYKARWFQSDDF
ncbi:MAG: hypothetical protein HUK22_00960 [Thermoguttaceae bacterium]|nr:hypothetical protein [Thermoguttaceae bacterium]